MFLSIFFPYEFSHYFPPKEKPAKSLWFAWGMLLVVCKVPISKWKNRGHRPNLGTFQMHPFHLHFVGRKLIWKGKEVRFFFWGVNVSQSEYVAFFFQHFFGVPSVTASSIFTWISQGRGHIPYHAKPLKAGATSSRAAKLLKEESKLVGFNLGVEPKIGVEPPPPNPWNFNRVFHEINKPSIFGG